MSLTPGTWLAGTVCALTLMGACSTPQEATRAFETSNCVPDAAWPAVDQAMADEVLRLTNEHRASIGAPLLSYEPALQDAAVWKARHMADGSYMDHDDLAPPVDRTFPQRVEDCGYTERPIRENIAMGYRTPEDVFAGWLDSPGHRSNIENPDTNVAGMAVAIDAGDDPYWVQVFAFSQPAASPSPNTSEGDDASAPADETPDVAVNQPPIAQPDRLRVRAGVRVRIGVTLNDDDPDGDEIKIVSVTPARFGSAKIDVATGSIIYRSRSSAAGKRERLTYTITDDSGATAQSVLVLPIK